MQWSKLMSEQKQAPDTADGASGEAEGQPKANPAGDPSSEMGQQSALKATVMKLQAETGQLRQQLEEKHNHYLQARADADNIRKRAERELQNAHKYALDKFVAELLPVKDSLEMGLAAIDENSEISKLREGTELTLRVLTAAVDKFGVAEIDPLGEKFNPEMHEAMAMQPSDEVEPNTVLQVIQKGYSLNDRLVRPAMVIVARAAPKS
jgi:molecular chaperone GrpE